MAITDEQVDHISCLSMVNITQQAAQNLLKDDLHCREVLAYSHHVRLTNPKIVDELWHRAHVQKVDTKDIIENILWDAFLPNEQQGQKPIKLVRVCPKCDSKDICELEDAGHWACYGYHAQFETPLWKQKGDRQ